MLLMMMDHRNISNQQDCGGEVTAKVQRPTGCLRMIWMGESSRKNQEEYKLDLKYLRWCDCQCITNILPLAM
jgi:hypothetical protein